MKRPFRVIGATLALIPLVIGGAALEQERQATRPKTHAKAEGFGITLKTDKHRYRPGDPISISLEVFNGREEEVTLDFATGQRYDFWLEDKNRKQVWRWSDGQFFAQVLSREILKPETPRLLYETQYMGKLEPGIYHLNGILANTPRPLTASVAVIVR